MARRSSSLRDACFSLGMIVQEAYVRELISGTTGEIAVAVILLIAWAFFSRRSR